MQSIDNSARQTKLTDKVKGSRENVGLSIS